MNKTVITGFGILTKHGESLSDLWKFLVSQKSIFKHDLFEKDIDKVIISINPATIETFNKIPKKKLRYLDKQVVFVLISALNAIKNSGLLDRFKELERMEEVGVVTGNFLAQMEFGIEQMEKLVNKKSLNISIYTGLAFYFGAATCEISVIPLQLHK
jgi:3-oxoacyl-(acyl-carrier-protein) synthase